MRGERLWGTLAAFARMRFRPRFLVSLALLLASAAGVAQDPRGLAQARYAAGVAHFDAGRHEDALRELDSSLDAVSSPNTRLMIARTLLALERPADAAYAYELTVAEARDLAIRQPRYAPTADAAAAELASLRPRLGRLRIQLAPEDARATLDGAVLAAAAIDTGLWVEPGDHEVRAQAEGFADARREVHLDAGDEADVSLTLTALTPDVIIQHPHRRLGIALGVIGVATLGAAVVTLVLAGAQHRDLQAQCDGACPEALQSDVTRGQRLARTGYTLSAVGALTLGSGLVLALLPGPQSAPGGARLRWQVRF